MCGIFGYVGPSPADSVILDGLRRLEYRGYDSAGIAVVKDGVMQVRRATGKLRNLGDRIQQEPMGGEYGVGHTRWATHGRPTEENAHPHRDCTGRIVVVHNGIIENYVVLKKKLIEVALPQPVVAAPSVTVEPSRWRFAGRWWSNPSSTTPIWTPPTGACCAPPARPPRWPS